MEDVDDDRPPVTHKLGTDTKQTDTKQTVEQKPTKKVQIAEKVRRESSQLRSHTMPDMSKKAEKVEKPKPKAAQSRMEQAVDELESGLATALSTYRRQAEDHITKHLQKLESMQTSTDLELSNLIVENTLLRERLGLKATEQLQPILFQATGIDVKVNQKKTAQADVTDDDDKHIPISRSRGEEKPLNSRKNAGKNQLPGGTWQPFVAWVPNGSALSNPEPWKPLPYQDIVLATPPIVTERKANKTKPKGGEENNHAIVPGSINPREYDQEPDSPGGSTGNEKLELLETWQVSQKSLKIKHSTTKTVAELESSIASSHEEEEYMTQQGPVKWWIVNPESTKRIIWDMLSLFMVVYDMIMVPMFVFNIPDNTFTDLMDWTTRLFWTSDILWSCCTGYVLDDGTIEYEPRAILHKYLHSWLSLDLFIVVSDYVGLIVSSGGVQVTKVARVFRVVRVIRLFRLVRMQEIVANIMERIQSDSILFFLQILKLLLLLAFICHFTACGWWGIGNISNGSLTWVDFFDVSEKELGFQYLVSLHWALIQFAGGLGQVVPKCTAEQLYAVVIFMLSFILGLVMLSSLTSNLTQQYIIGGSGARQIATLKKYLKQNKVSKNLSKRLCRNAKHAISGDLTPESVELLPVISEPLKIEMHFEMYSRVIDLHPFFNDLLGQGCLLVRQICHQAMSMLILATSDIAFSLGEEPSLPKMYIVVHGHLVYTDSYHEGTPVTVDEYLAEACLWTVWRHRGTLTASSDVKLALLDSSSFQHICKGHFKKNAGTALMIIQYANEFISELNKLSHPTDLPQT